MAIRMPLTKVVGKRKRSWNSTFNVAGKLKRKIKVQIPLDVAILFSHMVGKRLAIRYAHLNYSTLPSSINIREVTNPKSVILLPFH